MNSKLLILILLNLISLVNLKIKRKVIDEDIEWGENDIMYFVYFEAQKSAKLYWFRLVEFYYMKSIPGIF